MFVDICLHNAYPVLIVKSDYGTAFYCAMTLIFHYDVIKWKHFPRYWPFVRGIHRSPVNSPHKGQWRGALMFSLICARINSWVNNGEAGDLRRQRGHYDVIVMSSFISGLLKVWRFVWCQFNQPRPIPTPQTACLLYCEISVFTCTLGIILHHMCKFGRIGKWPVMCFQRFDK